LRDQRRELANTESGGLCFTAEAGRILGLTPNGFRDVVARGDLEPALTISNGATAGRTQVFWRHEVEEYRAFRERCEREAAQRRAEWRGAQSVLAFRR
jgi:hypothetical protein